MLRLDQIDYKLIELLQEDARMTQMDIAGKVGLSQPAIADRIHKLESSGYITGYAAQVDARKLGKDVTAFVGVSIGHPRHNGHFAKTIIAIPDVLECHRVTGEDSYLLKIKTDNTETLDRLISEKIRTIPGVTRTHTKIVMSSVKECARVYGSDGQTGMGKIRSKETR
jgi:Lrp/AsnC family leucine-responsive transcriptional regulator